MSINPLIIGTLNPNYTMGECPARRTIKKLHIISLLTFYVELFYFLKKSI